MATLDLPNKNNATLSTPVRSGKGFVIGDVQDLTFNDPLLADGTLVKDATFEQAADQAWDLPTKS